MAGQRDPDEHPYGWVVAWACFTVLAVVFGASYAFAAFFESLQTAFAATRADVSLVFGLSGLLYFVLGAGAGILADRFGPRAVVAAGMLCVAAGLAASSWAPTLTAVTLTYGIGLGVGIALVYTPAMASVPPWFTRRRGLAAGLASAGIGAGTLLVPLAVTWAIEVVQWRGALRGLALFVLLLGVGAAMLLRRAPATQSAASRPASGATLREALAQPSFQWLYAMCVLGGPSMFIPFAHVSAAARDLGVPDAQAVGLVGLIGIGSLSGRFLIGGLADRMGRSRTLVVMQVSLGLAFLAWALADGYWAMAVFAAWMGLSYGGIVSLMPALCMDLYGGRAVSSILGVLYTGAGVGNLAGPWLAGFVFDATGRYAGVIGGCMALSALATLSAWRALRGH